MPKPEQPTLPVHGAPVLPSVEVDSYNLEIEDEDGFIGDKASRRAFRELLENWREPLRKLGDDPLGDKSSEKISKKKLEALIKDGTPEAAGVVQSAVEEFAQELAGVIRRFLKTKAWRDTECIVVGGGLCGGRVGELAVGRSAVLLKAEGTVVDLEVIRHDPDEAGLLGAAHLLPGWMLTGKDGLLAIDVGGTNIRVGVVELNLDKAKDLSKASVLDAKSWRHADEDLKRDDILARIGDMLHDLVKAAKKGGVSLAPVVGIGCPGVINPDGSIERGAQNLPGNWESPRFNFPQHVRELLPHIDGQETLVVMHNDAVVQGLSQLPFVQAREHWGVLTIGTGLGNARFTNRSPKRKEKKN